MTNNNVLVGNQFLKNPSPWAIWQKTTFWSASWKLWGIVGNGEEAQTVVERLFHIYPASDWKISPYK